MGDTNNADVTGFCLFTAETKHKKHCKLHFICFGQDEQCLYSDNFFTLRSRHHKTWIHIMFLAIQVCFKARHHSQLMYNAIFTAL